MINVVRYVALILLVAGFPALAQTAAAPGSVTSNGIVSLGTGTSAIPSTAYSTPTAPTPPTPATTTGGSATGSTGGTATATTAGSARPTGSVASTGGTSGSPSSTS